MKLRFSLRALLGATVLAAILLGWWADHRRLANRESTTIHMFVKDSFEFQTSWPIGRLELSSSDAPVCDVVHDRRRIRLFARNPGAVTLTLWENGQPRPSQLMVVVSPSP